MIYLNIAILAIFLSLQSITSPAYGFNITKREIDDKLFQYVEFSFDKHNIEDLLRQGADPDAESLANVNGVEAGETIWLMALERSSPETIALLKKYRRSSSPMPPKFQAYAFSAAMSTSQNDNPNYSQERMQLLISNGLDINAINLEDLTHKARRGDDGESPLMIAAQKDREDFVKFLISKGADVKLQAQTGETVLFFARSAAITRDLLEAGADAGAVGEYGRTALHEAIFEGRAEVVSVLLDKGGDLKMQKAEEALLLACRIMRQTSNKDAAKNSPMIIKMLLAHGVDPNLIIENKGWKDSPLFEAVRANNAAGVKLLLDAGADPLKLSLGKETLLEQAVRQDDPEITRILLPHYLPLSDEAKRNLLQFVLQQGNPKVLTVLAENGLKFAEVKDSPTTIAAAEGLIHAVNESKVDMVQALLKQGVNINASGYNQTPLTAAIQYKNSGMIEFLVENGADVNLADKSGMTPLASAIANGNGDIYKFLRSKKAVAVSNDPAVSYLHLAIEGLFYATIFSDNNGDLDILRDLLGAGNPADQLDSRGTTPLWELATQLSKNATAGHNAVESAKLLLQHGASIDFVPAQCKNVLQGDTAIDPQMELDYLCRTPLSNAAAVGNQGVAMVLIDADAQISWQSPVTGETPLMLAAYHGDPKLVSLLLKKGADPKLRNKHNQTAADIARERDNTKALSILETFGKG